MMKIVDQGDVSFGHLAGKGDAVTLQGFEAKANEFSREMKPTASEALIILGLLVVMPSRG